MELPDNTVSSTRRAWLGGMIAAVAGLAAGTSLGASPARAHSNAGVVTPPLPPPDVSLTLDDGKTTSLRHLLKDKVSAVQLMFTSCPATCPIQGALFADGARTLGDRIGDAQWLSLSIDPGRDDPSALRAWMGRFGSHPRWRAARPVGAQLDALVDFLKARNPGPDRHTAQVYFFNRQGALTLRSVDFPSTLEMLRVLEDMASGKTARN